MKSDMKNEFEEYVSKLTSSICKDIFLEEFKNLCNQMNQNMETYEELSDQISETKAKLDEELIVLKNEALFTVQNMEAENKKLKGYTSVLFDELKQQHLRENEQYRIDLDAYLENKKKQIQKRRKMQLSDMEKVFEGTITQSDIQQFVEEIRDNARQSKELATFINSTYKDEIEKSIIEFLRQTDKAQFDVQEKITRHVDEVLKQLDIAVSEDQTSINKYAEEFQEKVNKLVVALAEYLKKVINTDKQHRDEFLKKQEELIAQIGSKDEKIDQLNARIIEFEKLVKKLEADNDAKNMHLEAVLNEYIRKQSELDQKRYLEIESIEKRAESLSWKMYITFTNTLLVCILGLLIFLQAPWERFGVRATVIVTIVFASLIVMFISLKRIVAKSIVKRKVSKNVK